MRRPVLRFVEVAVDLIDPVHDGGDARAVGGPIAVRVAVLEGVKRLSHSDVEGDQRRVEPTAQGQMNRQRRPERRIGPAPVVQAAQGLVQTREDEGAAVSQRRRSPVGLRHAGAVQAVPELVPWIAVHQGKPAEVVAVLALEVVVPHADEQRRAAQIPHVGGHGEREIGNERTLVAARRQGARGRPLRAHDAQRACRQLFMAAPRRYRVDGEPARRGGSAQQRACHHQGQRGGSDRRRFERAASFVAQRSRHCWEVPTRTVAVKEGQNPRRRPGLTEWFSSSG